MARSFRRELLDEPDPDPAELRTNLEDLSRINHRWGGSRSTLRLLAPRLSDWPRNRPLRILDVGAGGCDLLVALARCCRAHRIPAMLVGVDRSPAVLEIARTAVSEFPEIRLLLSDALELPFPPKSFDFVLCSLVLHHVPPQQAATFLRALGILAREGAVVSDLRRGRREYLLTLIFTRLFARGRMTRLDAPLSVLRALTLPEARDLALRAGWDVGRVRKSFPLRFLLLDREL